MKLRGAVVGVGYLGNYHAQKINAHAEADLVGVCDFSFAQAQKVATELATTAYATPQELFGKVDFVQIAASTQAHYDLATLFLLSASKQYCFFYFFALTQKNNKKSQDKRHCSAGFAGPRHTNTLIN